MDRALPDVFRRQDARRVREPFVDASQYGDCAVTHAISDMRSDERRF